MATHPDDSNPAHRDKLTRGEVIVACVIILVCAGILIAFGTGHFDSAIVSAFALGLIAATVTYHFLGGVESAVFNLPWVRLSGAAALLLAATFGTRDQFKRELDERLSLEKAVGDATAQYKEAIENDQVEKTRLRLRITTLEKTPTCAAGVCDDPAIIARIAAAKQDSHLAADLRAVQKRKQGPWSETLARVDVRITFHAKRQEKSGQPLFTACDQLGFAGRRVRFSLPETMNPDGNPVVADFAGPIDTNQCEGNFANRVQLSCASAKELLQGQIAACGSDGRVLWAPTFRSIKFAGVATVLADPD